MFARILLSSPHCAWRTGMGTVVDWRPQRLCTHAETCTHACLARPYGTNQTLPHGSKNVMHFPPFSVIRLWYDTLYFEQLQWLSFVNDHCSMKLMCCPGYLAEIWSLGCSGYFIMPGVVIRSCLLSFLFPCFARSSFGLQTCADVFVPSLFMI